MNSCDDPEDAAWFNDNYAVVRAARLGDVGVVSALCGSGRLDPDLPGRDGRRALQLVADFSVMGPAGGDGGEVTTAAATTIIPENDEEDPEHEEEYMEREMVFLEKKNYVVYRFKYFSTRR